MDFSYNVKAPSSPFLSLFLMLQTKRKDFYWETFSNYILFIFGGAWKVQNFSSFEAHPVKGAVWNIKSLFYWKFDHLFSECTRKEKVPEMYLWKIYLSWRAWILVPNCELLYDFLLQLFSFSQRLNVPNDGVHKILWRRAIPKMLTPSTHPLISLDLR